MSEKIKCLIDNTEYDSIESFHMHLRRFKIKQKDYYESKDFNFVHRQLMQKSNGRGYIEIF